MGGEFTRKCNVMDVFIYHGIPFSLEPDGLVRDQRLRIARRQISHLHFADRSWILSSRLLCSMAYLGN